eukprot:UN34827
MKDNKLLNEVLDKWYLRQSLRDTTGDILFPYEDINSYDHILHQDFIDYGVDSDVAKDILSYITHRCKKISHNLKKFIVNNKYPAVSKMKQRKNNFTIRKTACGYP